MDPISLALMGGTALTQFLGGAAGRAEQQRALAEQMRQFDQQMRFAKAARTDAYGNTVRFDDATQRWLTDLTPTQRALLRAGEHEQFLGLTEDAARNREARRRMATIGAQSAEDYNRESAAYRYGPQKSEDQIINELTQLVGRGRTAGNNTFLRQRLRQGRPNVFSNTGPETFGPNSADDSLRIRRAALEELGVRNNLRNQRLQPLGFFREGAGAGGGAPLNFDNQSNELSGTQDKMAQLIASVGKSGADNLLQARQGIAKATQSMFPTMSDGARTIAALRRGTPGVRSGRASTSLGSSPDFAQASPDFPYEYELGL